MDQPRKVAKPARGQLNREIKYLKKNLNAPRPPEHPPVREENVKMFRWDHRLQINTKPLHGIYTGSPMVVTLGQQYNVGEKPTVNLYTYINRHAGTPDKKQKQNRNNAVQHPTWL